MIYVIVNNVSVFVMGDGREALGAKKEVAYISLLFEANVSKTWMVDISGK